MKVKVGIKKQSKSSIHQAQKRNPEKNDESTKLAALLTEFQEFKRVTTAERDALVSEHNALAKEVCDLRDQIEEASLVSKENEAAESKKNDMMTEIKNQVETTAQNALVTVADKFDENGYMKCCMSSCK